MSESNKPELNLITSEVETAEPFDFEFISFSLGLVTICNGDAAINVANIASIEKAEDGDGWLLTLINNQEYSLEIEDMINLEQHLKERKANRKEVVKEEMAAQIQASIELQGNVQPGKIVGVGGKRFH